MPRQAHLALIVFNARTADRNPRGMAGAAMLGKALSQTLGLQATDIGKPEAPLNAHWQQELDAARPMLHVLAHACEQVFAERKTPLIVMGRCASALATLPVLARHHPETLLVWFDAHADANTPASTSSGYLGGMVIAGAAGLWDSGLGSGLQWPNVLLVGTRDVDPFEQTLIDSGTLRIVPPGKNLATRLHAAVGKRPVYFHIDCDVLEPGIAPTEYRVPGGLTLADLRACSEVLAQHEVVGIEIAEFEAAWADSGLAASPDGLIDALLPLLDAMR